MIDRLIDKISEYELKVEEAKELYAGALITGVRVRYWSDTLEKYELVLRELKEVANESI